VRYILMVLATLPAVALADGPAWSPPPNWPPILRDVASRLPRHTDAKDADLITYVHEGTHFLSRWRAGGHCVYVLDGARWCISTPPLQTETVLSAVPAEVRGSIYQTYLKQARTEYWRDQPLMIVDEWNAYAHGGIARRQIGTTSRSETNVYSWHFAQYARVLVRLARDCEGYDSAELRRFCNWNLARCRENAPELDWDFDY
jgi:hypothetical protein